MIVEACAISTKDVDVVHHHASAADVAHIVIATATTQLRLVPSTKRLSSISHEQSQLRTAWSSSIKSCVLQRSAAQVGRCPQHAAASGATAHPDWTRYCLIPQQVKQCVNVPAEPLGLQQHKPPDSSPGARRSACTTRCLATQNLVFAHACMVKSKCNCL